MDITAEPLEIERKFMIEMPSEELLRRVSTKRLALSQIYLLPDAEGGSRRLRRTRRENGEEVLTYSQKIRITDETRIEREREIDAAEYAALLAEADPTCRTVEKTRWCVPFAGHILEIDVFPFWSDRAFLEAELQSEEEELLLPDWIGVIRELTADPRYTNHALAREIPE